MADRFTKMHGLGNDFVVIDARVASVEMTPARAHAIADRRHGIGCDQLILLEPSASADVKMRIFNADGGAEVTLGEPAFEWEQIPLAMPMDTRDMPVAWDELEHGAAVNVGNPHIVFFVPEADAVALGELGPRIETDPLFPERVNVNVASLDGENQLQLRVWERGVGLTQACGTGACATAVAAIRAGLVQSPVTLSLPGGDLVIRWAPGAPIVMSGAATRVYEGETDWAQFG